MSASETGINRSEFTVRRVARLVIEFTTPFRVGSGQGDIVADADAVREINGLPFIPGSSLAGALRARLFARDAGLASLVFGYQSRTDNKGAGSRLTLSHGLIHASNGTPVEGWLADELVDDLVLADARGGELRDHVRITHRGVADSEGHGKFDERLVSAGHRFTFELELVDQPGEENGAAWAQLLAALTEDSFRLGGGSRRGLGAFRLVPGLCRQRSFQLTDDADRAAYIAHDPRLAVASVGLAADWPDAQSAASGALLTRHLQISPAGYWMIGSGADEIGKRPAGKAPVRTTLIEWEKDTAARVEKNCLVIPGSSLKGALAHRTAFHYNRLKQIFADIETDPAEHTGEKNPAIKALFGEAKAEKMGRRGAVLIGDFILSSEASRLGKNQRVDHVAIDRFTGGALGSALYDERVLWQGDALPGLSVTVTDAAREDCAADSAILQAFKAALDDLAAGRLALGAGASRGYGFFKPSPVKPT